MSVISLCITAGLRAVNAETESEFRKNEWWYEYLIDASGVKL